MKTKTFNIELPVPATLNPLEKLSYDAHNKVALKNFDAVGGALKEVIKVQEDLELRIKKLENLKEESKDDEPTTH